MLATLLSLSACSAPLREVALRTQELDSAMSVQFQDLGCLIVSDRTAIQPWVRPLSPRLGLLEIPIEELAAIAPAIVGLTELPETGSVIGLVHTLGQTLTGERPIEVTRLRFRAGAGQLEIAIPSQTFLPDATSYIQLISVPYPVTIMVVDVNDARFFPADAPAAVAVTAGGR